ncbi:nucleotidyltransferase family protein (plasmid) [Clostridium perfringens]|uniref:nucleotidyltransferase family protein n=1 Tax=Clostridium perfringens TaxID=1502 RepID=UPI0030CF00F0
MNKEILIYNIHNYSNMKNVFEKLENIPYAVIKGEPLSFLCYGEYSMRHRGDIDILVPREYIEEVEKILITEGFMNNLNNKTENRKNRILCLAYSHQLPPFIKETKNGRIEVDVNFDILWGECKFKNIDIKNFLSDPYIQKIHGCNVKTLSPLKSALQLILHHYKEMNSLYHLAVHPCIKREMFYDVYLLLKNNSNEITAKNLYLLSEKYKVSPYIYYVLYYTNIIFNEPFLKQYCEFFECPKGNKLINCYGLDEKERKEWHVDFSSRLDNENLFDLIKNDLSKEDIDKIKRGVEIFG